MSAVINTFPIHLIKKCINILLSENSIINNTDIINIHTLYATKNWNPDTFVHELPVALYDDVMKELIRLRNGEIKSIDILKASIESKFNQPTVLQPGFYQKLENIIFDEISTEEIEEMRTVVTANIERAVMFNSVPMIDDLVSRIKISSIEDLDNLITEFRSTMSEVNHKIKNIKKASNKLENLILTPDNIQDLTSHVHTELNRKNRKIKTNVKAFDRVYGGGLEPGTAHLLGAGTGQRKSLTLLNLVESMATGNKLSEFQTKDPTKKPLIVYISFENVQSASFLRLCKLISNKNQEEFKLSDPNAIQQEIAEHLNDAIPIKLVYAPSYTVSIQDLHKYCENNVDETGQGYETVAIVIDYLALFNAPQNAENHRLGLSLTMRGLADYGVINNVASLTAIQLNAESDNAAKLTRNAAAESKAILDHCDSVVFFRTHSLIPGQNSLGSSFDYDNIEDPNKITFLEAYSVKSRSSEDNPDQRIIIPFDKKNPARLTRTNEKDFFDDGSVEMDVVDEFLNTKFGIKTGKINAAPSDGTAHIPPEILGTTEQGKNPYETT